MTSKEALQDLRFYTSLSQGACPYSECNELCDLIEKDLEVLELIKQELGDMFLDAINYIIEDDTLGEVEIHPNLLKIKEWLEK